jgi:hypothetical protein
VGFAWPGPWDPWDVLGAGAFVGGCAVAVVGRGLADSPGAALDAGSPEDAQDAQNATSRPTSAAVPAQPAFTARV